MSETDKQSTVKDNQQARNEFWKQMKRVMDHSNYDPTRYIAGMHRLGFEFSSNGWQARRSMRRVTRDGR